MVVKDAPELKGRTRRVLENYGPECVYCSVTLTCLNCTDALERRTTGYDGDEMTIDHVRCVSHGGSNWIGNLLPACRACNTCRGDRAIQDYLSICIDQDKLPRTEIILAAITRLRDPRSRKGYWLSTLYPDQAEQLRLLDRQKDQQLVGRAVGEALFGDKTFSFQGALYKTLKIELGDNYRRR